MTLDINECTENVAICGIHTCSNTDGSYECICNAGYEVADDNQTCIGKYQIVMIIIHIKRFNLLNDTSCLFFSFS